MHQEQGLFTIHTPHLRAYVVRLINISKKLEGPLSIQAKLSKIWRQRRRHQFPEKFPEIPETVEFPKCEPFNRKF